MLVSILDKTSYRKIAYPRDGLTCSYRFELCQVVREQCCQMACCLHSSISNLKTEFKAFVS